MERGTSDRHCLSIARFTRFITASPLVSHQRPDLRGIAGNMKKPDGTNHGSGMKKYMSAEESRRQIMEATERLIVRHGLGAATTRAIAKEAGCSLSKLHYAFSEKEDIFAALIEAHAETLEQVFNAIEVIKKRSLAANLGALIQQYTKSAIENPNVHMAQYELMVWSLKTPGRGRETTNAALFHRGIMLLISQIVSEQEVNRLDISRLALLILCEIEGFITQAINGLVKLDPT